MRNNRVEYRKSEITETIDVAKNDTCQKKTQRLVAPRSEVFSTDIMIGEFEEREPFLAR